MSILKKVSIKRAVAQAQDNMGIEENNLYPVMKVWAAEGEHRIDTFTMYRQKIYVLDVDGCCVNIPCEAVAIDGLLLGDHGCECDTIFSSIYGSSGTNGSSVSSYGFIVVDGGGTCMNTSAAYDIYNNQIHFKKKFHGKITVRFFVQEVDSEGWMLINENHVYALAAFIEWMWMQRAKHKVGGVKYTRGEIQDQFMLWSRLAASAAVEDVRPTKQEEENIARAFNDPTSGYGSALWLYRNSYYGIQPVI